MTLQFNYKQHITTKNLLAILVLGYFAIQPWDRHFADALWLLLSLASLAYVAAKKYQGQSLNTPKPLKNLLWLFTLMPVVSVISYLASPLDTLTPKALEPDTRWLLIIPITLAMLHTRIGPKYILSFLSIYAVSSFISAITETSYLTQLSSRANGDENAVPYGMFNATVALMLLTYFISHYIKDPKQTRIRLLRPSIFIAFTLAVASAFLSGTRASMLLLPIVITLLYFMHYNVKKTLLGLALLLGIGSVIISAQTDSAFVKNLISTPAKINNYFTKNDRASKRSSAGQRLEQWKESVCIFSIHPILGTGPRSFKYAHQAYGGKKHCNAVQYLKQGSYQAHSVYFNTLGTLGLVGMLAALVLSLTLIQTGISEFKRNDKTIKLGASLLITAIASHAINGITLDLWFMNHVMNKHLLILILPLLLIFYKSKKPTPNTAELNPI